MTTQTIGATRTVTRFAWLPTFTTDGVVWLRRYWAREEYAETDAEPWGPAFDWRRVAAFRTEQAARSH